jgi:hypothetical protein
MWSPIHPENVRKSLKGEIGRLETVLASSRDKCFLVIEHEGNVISDGYLWTTLISVLKQLRLYKNISDVRLKKSAVYIFPSTSQAEDWSKDRQESGLSANHVRKRRRNHKREIAIVTKWSLRIFGAHQAQASGINFQCGLASLLWRGPLDRQVLGFGNPGKLFGVTIPAPKLFHSLPDR